MLKKLLLSTVAGLLFAASASAQVNVIPQVGLITGTLKDSTYAAASVALVPAASATDIFCIAASSSKNIFLKRLLVSGTAGTAISTPLLIYRRATADTGGTAATGLALPVAVPNYTTDPASTATLTAYTANPTVTDSSPALLASFELPLPVSTGASPALVFDLNGNDLFTRHIVIAKGSTQQVCLNLNGVSISSGSLVITVIWTESF